MKFLTILTAVTKDILTDFHSSTAHENDGSEMNLKASRSLEQSLSL